MFVINKKWIRRFLLVGVYLIGFLGIVASGGGGGGNGFDAGANLTGTAQKGPLIQDSSVQIQPLDSNLNPTGQIFSTQVINDFGEFSFDREITSPYVEIMVEGFFFDEISGLLSGSTIALRAFAEVTNNMDVKVNSLTTLQINRIKHLIRNGASFQDAQTQSIGEVLALFNIPSAGIAEFTDMDITGSTDSDAVLLATSAILMQMAYDIGASPPADQLATILAQMSTDLEIDGTIDPADANYQQIGISSQNANLPVIRNNLINIYASLGQTVTPSNFEDYVDSDGDGDLQDAPIFTSATAVSVEENTIIAYTATATDADGDILTFSLTGGSDQALFSLDTMTGVLSFNTAPDFDAPADSDGNNTYVVEITVTDGIYQVSQIVTVTVEPGPTITLSIYTPIDNQLVETEVYVSATVQSDFDISSVTASVESNSTNLTFSSDAVCTGMIPICEPGFGGTLSLSGLVPGTYDLTVTVEDVLGSIVSDQRSIILDNKPTITINEPIQFSVARPNLPLEVSCTDDLGSCEITVRVESSAPIASGTNVLSETIDLSAYDGSAVNLSVTATDSSNQATTENLTIYVETSTKLVLVKDFPSQIIDFDGTRALVLTPGDSGDSLTIQYTTSDTVTDVEVLPNLIVTPTRSFLSPTGVIYTTKEVGGNVLTSRIYDWNNSNLRDLGHPNSSSSLTVSGDYAIWSEGQTLWLRQFSTETNNQVSTSAGNWYNSVASNGVVGYWTGAGTDYSIVRYDAGVNTTLASDTAYWNTYVVTDGSGFVYRKHDPCCGDQQYSITFHDGISELALTNFRDQEPSPPRDYQINNGWIAFTDLGGLGQTHVWTRDPLGILLQRTVFGSNSYIDGLSSDGEVMLINNGERHHSNAVGLLSSVNSTLGSSTNISGTWFIFIGRSLFEISL